MGSLGDYIDNRKNLCGFFIFTLSQFKIISNAVLPGWMVFKLKLK